MICGGKGIKPQNIVFESFETQNFALCKFNKIFDNIFLNFYNKSFANLLDFALYIYYNHVCVTAINDMR